MHESNPLPLEALQALVELSSDGACLVDPDDGRLMYANPSLFDWLRPWDTTPRDSSISDLIPEWQSPAVQAQVTQLLAGACDEIAFQGHFAPSGLDGPATQICARRVASTGCLLLAVVIRSPATGGKVPGISGRAGVDPLTGLADRALLLDKLTTMVHGDRSSDQRCAVLFIDVDGFKQVNDSYGHLVGDRVLGEVAGRLAGAVRAGDLVARFGGDEFVVLLERVDGRHAIEPVIRRITAAFRRPIPLPQGEVTLTLSVGAAQAGVDGDSAETLIDAADRAMYAAKRATA